MNGITAFILALLALGAYVILTGNMALSNLFMAIFG